jgi:predicted RNase H-like nuclease
MTGGARSETTFVGVDLAWQSARNHSGLAAFRGGDAGARPLAVGSGASDLEGVVEFVREHGGAGPTVVAIDAPLVVANERGQRPCERAISQRFGRAHAGAHPSNRTLYPDPGGVELARRLRREGFRHCTPPGGAWIRTGRWFFEVYPHPAQVVLFELDRIIKYKKGRVAARRAGLAELRAEIARRLVGRGRLRSDPRLRELLSRDLDRIRGAALKRYEDGLDAIVCAFLAHHLWRFGWQGSELIGDLADGYIVVPRAARTAG